jgi:hypothetical protein
MKSLLLSFFLLLNNPQYAMVEALEMPTHECIELRNDLRETIDNEYDYGDSVIKHKGQDVIYLGSECLPILPRHEIKAQQ